MNDYEFQDFLDTTLRRARGIAGMIATDSELDDIVVNSADAACDLLDQIEVALNRWWDVTAKDRHIQDVARGMAPWSGKKVAGNG